MHKLILFLIFTLIGTHTLNAQDLIVTTKGDSINCHITIKTYNYLRFRVQHDNQTEAITLPLNEVSAYQYNFYPGTVIPKPRKIRNHDYQHWRMGLAGGWSKHTAQTSPYLSLDEKQRVEDLKTGKNVGAGIQYFTSEHDAVGLKYVNFSSSFENRTQFIISKGDLSINYLGASYGKRWLNVGKRNTLLFNLGPGYVTYRYGKDQPWLKGRNIGWMADLGYDVFLSDLASLGFEVSFLKARLKKIDSYNNGHYFTTYELRQGNYEGLNRLDFSLGIRFNLP